MPMPVVAPPPGWQARPPGVPTDGGAGSSKRPWVIGAVIALLLLGIGAIVAVAMSDDDDEDDAAPAVATTVVTDEPAGTVAATAAPATDDTATTAATTADTGTETTTAVTEAPSTTAATTTTGAATTTAPNGEPGGSGTLDDPLSWGTTAPVGADWQIAVLDVDLDADDDVAAANPSNSPAPAGSKYAVVRVEATYTGGSSGSPYFNLDVGVVDATGAEHADTGCTAVLEDDMVSAPSLAPGESAEGTFCIIVPTTVGDGTTAFVGLFGDDTTPPVFWVAR
jgi:hypothetical protein